MNWYRYAQSFNFRAPANLSKNDIADDNLRVKENNPVPPETCPEINQVIKGIRQAMDAANNAERATSKASLYCENENPYFDEIVSEINSVTYWLEGLEKTLEEIRAANQNLRELGKTWHQQAKWIEKGFPPTNTDDTYFSTTPNLASSPSIVQSSKRSSIQVLKDNKLKLTPEEHKKIIEGRAVWHHGPNGEESPAIWKSKNSKGEIVFVTNTHRCYQTSDNLDECIRLFHDVVKETY